MYGNQQSYPPNNQQSYPPANQSYPPQQGGQSYPPTNNHSQSYPGQQQGGYPPPQQNNQSYPAFGNSQQYPPANQSYPGQSYPPQSQGQSYPPQSQGQAYPPQSQGQSYPAQQQQPQGRPGGYPPAGGQQQQYHQHSASYPGAAPGGYPNQQHQPGQYGAQQPQYGAQQPQYGGQQQYGQPGYGAAMPVQPIVDKAYCLPREQVFFLEESVMSLSGDDFTIKDASNPSHYYKLCSSAFSMKGSRVLKDSGGRTILNMRHKLMSGNLWYINRATNDKDVIAEVKKPMGWVPGRPACVEIYLRGNSSHHFSTPRPDFVGQGDVRGKALMIYRGQQPVAEISRKLAQESSKQRMTGKDSYALKVFPNVDAAFFIAVCLAIDELFHD